MATAYDRIAQNQRKVWILTALFPVVFSLFAYLVIMVCNLAWLQTLPAFEINMLRKSLAPASPLLYYTGKVAVVAIPIIAGLAALWLLQAYFLGAEIIIGRAKAREVTFESDRQLYQVVENLCITRNLPMPKISVIQDTALNSFATGRNLKHASIVVTSGLLNALEKPELQAVMAHELAHIENGDITLTLLVVEGITFFTFMGESLFKSDGLSGNLMRQMRSIHGINGLTYILGPLVALLVTAVLMFVGVIFIIFGGLIAPILRFAISRQQEFAADATAALITRNPGALASALEKIAQNPKARVLCLNSSMSLMCIYSPREIAMSLLNRLSGLYASHPPIAERIAKLKAMDAAVLRLKTKSV